eukprot:2429224-Rhodomonas_salina.1
MGYAPGPGVLAARSTVQSSSDLVLLVLNFPPDGPGNTPLPYSPGAGSCLARLYWLGAGLSLAVCTTQSRYDFVLLCVEPRVTSNSTTLGKSGRASYHIESSAASPEV